MSAKIIVQRFEEENNFWTLYVTIGENDKNVEDIQYSAWHVGKAEIKKKEKDKPRLVIKMVSDGNYNSLNLDECSKAVDFADKHLTEILNKNKQCDVKDIIIRHKRNECDSSLSLYKKYFEALNRQPRINNVTQIQCKIPQLYARYFNNKTDDETDPLEYCIEKVKKNNALIMENIHMLNRTLNYTKKKEILDIINPRPLRSYPCNTCGKCFVYETGLQRHYSVRHCNLDTQPRWQLVWTCTNCFQVWPRQELAIKHATQCCNSRNADDAVQEIKTSSLLRCEFCEKVFTCIPRLLSHTNFHSVTNNYKCNACDVVFSCYKTAEQHWLSCLWLKMCYQFSLPKLLLCNACDRKFKNYDQLYNHRYKVGHFIPKTFDENNGAFTSTPVYQCEVCGHWFSAVSQLYVHRSQYHPQFDNGTYNIVS
ncbi:zinc finger protein 468 [Bicyclus anynana]|uniref:Zinc finger protein 468 n=1 Tax=Bicyclus anynana TaxID=110368 RepID=A0ABM3LHR4_BICAN|nr:zinc finger protein 468 [Bicyclus anynana]